ncbi:MAG: hypothetical protein A3J97_02455 [Spirochaetes bacterium RIFOXYC1_FULL_54_7]|nr:MAG: hypothetical protein A3J97_02455 [Spirochaetes bacterium RIFOXYC1_FULL_54_7]
MPFDPVLTTTVKLAVDKIIVIYGQQVNCRYGRDEGVWGVARSLQRHRVWGLPQSLQEGRACPPFSLGQDPVKLVSGNTPWLLTKNWQFYIVTGVVTDML